MELTAFVRAFAHGVRNGTDSTFNQSRRKVEPGVFKQLMRVMNQEFYTDNDACVKRWEGLRLLATDGAIKNIARVEHSTGHTDVVIQQDFHRALFMCKLHALLLDEANHHLPDAHTQRKLTCKINGNSSFGYMNQEVLHILADRNDERSSPDLSELFLSSTVPIRPGGSFPRDREKHRTRNKSVHLTNSRPAL